MGKISGMTNATAKMMATELANVANACLMAVVIATEMEIVTLPPSLSDRHYCCHNWHHYCHRHGCCHCHRHFHDNLLIHNPAIATASTKKTD